MSEPAIKNGSQHPEVHKRHFRVFDTLRFFAFLKVFLQHLPIFAFGWFGYLKAGGVIGVHFFFVLSGFLITYIICAEKKATGSYNLKNFFARRVLRIWPLFYLILAISYAIPVLLHALHLPKTDMGYTPTWWASVLFLENYKMIFTHSLPNVPELAVTWSLCIEEHFYIVWGLLLWVLPLKAIPKIIAVCIVLALASRLVFYHYDLDPTDLFTNIDLFAFGAIPAYLLVFYEQGTEAFINRLPRAVTVLYITFVVLFVLVTAQIKDIVACNIWLRTVSGVVFSGLIFLSMSSRTFKKPPSLLNKAGIYTYGLYMYHVLMIVILARVFAYMHLSLDSALPALAFVVAALGATILCSVISYKYFEQPFLRLKRFFRGS